MQTKLYDHENLLTTQWILEHIFLVAICISI